MAWFLASSFLCFPQEREGPGVEEVILLYLAPCAGDVLENCFYLRWGIVFCVHLCCD